MNIKYLFLCVLEQFCVAWPWVIMVAREISKVALSSENFQNQLAVFIETQGLKYIQPFKKNNRYYSKCPQLSSGSCLGPL